MGLNVHLNCRPATREEVGGVGGKRWRGGNNGKCREKEVCKSKRVRLYVVLNEERRQGGLLLSL